MLRQKQNNIEVSVVDDGPGMSEEAKGDTSRASSGNGLGLTLAKRIVDLHGGTISVSSKEGKGTTFTVILPVKRPESI